MEAPTDPAKKGAIRRKSRPLTSALVSLRSRRSSAVQSLMYDEEGNRRRLFSGSSAGGGRSSGDSVCSQARGDVSTCTSTPSLPQRKPWRFPAASTVLIELSMLAAGGALNAPEFTSKRSVVHVAAARAQGSTVYMSCAGGSRRASSITTDGEPPAASAQVQGSFAPSSSAAPQPPHPAQILHLKLDLLPLQDGKRGSVGGGWGRSSAAEEGDVGGDGRALLIDARGNANQGLLSADSLLYDSTGARRNTRFWRRS